MERYEDLLKIFKKFLEEVNQMNEIRLTQPPSDNASSLLNNLLQNILNQIMLSERNIFLASNSSDKANGFYQRNLSLPTGELTLSVPRTRSSSFRPSVLPLKWQRSHDSILKILYSLIVSGFSDEAISSFLHSLNLPYQATAIRQIKEDLKANLQDFKSKQLPPELFAVFIDAYRTDVKFQNKVKNFTTYTVLGIDPSGKKIPLGIYSFPTYESTSCWKVVLNDLISRGL